LTNAITWALQHASSTAVTVGLIIYDSVTASLQIVTTAGTIGSSVPSFSATAGTVTSDGATVKWTSLGLASTFQYWKAPLARFQTAFATSFAGAGATVYIGSDHAETQAAAMTVTLPTALTAITSTYCVDHTANLPPTSSNLATTAKITTTGANAMTLAGYQCWYCYGVTFSCGSGATNAVLNIGSTSNEYWRFDSCAFIKAGTTGTASAITVNAANYIDFNNTTFTFGSTTDSLYFNGSLIRWKNTASAIGGSTLPAILFNHQGGSATGIFVVEGVDLSAITGTLVPASPETVQWFQFRNCKFGSGVTVAAIPTGALASSIVDVIFSDSTGTTYQQQRWRYAGSSIPSTTVVRTGGASTNGTPISWKIATSANSVWLSPFEEPPTWLYNGTTGSNVTVTLYGIWFGSALPNNDQIWHDVEYMGSSGSPIASLGSGTKANNLASGVAWASDTSAWDAAATARANSTVYAVGNIFKQSGSPGSLFIVTAIGSSPHQSAASPPAGYTSAADGAVITDGNLTVQAGYRFAMTVTLSAPQPQLAGYLYSYVKAALASTTFYIDPLIVL